MVDYAGFWVRVGGFILDYFINLFFIGIPVVIFQMIGGVFIASTSSCSATTNAAGGAVQTCSPSLALAILLWLFTIVFALGVWWKLIPSRMSRVRATRGMEIMKIEIVSAAAGGAIRSMIALWRALVSSLLPWMLMAPIVIWLRLHKNWTRFDFIVLVGGATLPFIPVLWQLVDPRHQTLYDKFSGTAVIRSSYRGKSVTNS